MTEKTAVVVLAGSQDHADMGYAANALETAQQFKEKGHEVQLIFDGAGTTWIPKLTDEEHDLNPVFQAVQGTVAGACEFCGNAFQVADEIEQSSVPMLSEHNGHPDLAARAEDGYRILTF